MTDLVRLRTWIAKAKKGSLQRSAPGLFLTVAMFVYVCIHMLADLEGFGTCSVTSNCINVSNIWVWVVWLIALTLLIDGLLDGLLNDKHQLPLAKMGRKRVYTSATLGEIQKY
jgi:hypothetical protein